MRFGICTNLDNAAVVSDAGWDFVEGSVQSLFQGEVPDAAWKRPTAGVEVPAANLLVPKHLKITGPEARIDRLRDYMTRVVDRAASTDTKILVFGSGGARQVPDAFEAAKRQIIDFARVCAELGAARDVTIVVEPLNRGECNIINSIPEAMEYVRAVGHPNLQCLLDTYHFWLENEPDQDVTANVKSIRHVHVADRDGRTPPGESGSSDYRPLFGILKRAGYEGLISVEAGSWTNLPEQAPRVLEFLKSQWSEA